MPEFGKETLFSTLGNAKLVKWIKAPTAAGPCSITGNVSFPVSSNRSRRPKPFRASPGRRLERRKLRIPQALPHAVSGRNHSPVGEAQCSRLGERFALQLFAGIRTEQLCRAREGDRRPLQWSDQDEPTNLRDLLPASARITPERTIYAERRLQAPPN